jgi:hypothetical protein
MPHAAPAPLLRQRPCSFLSPGRKLAPPQPTHLARPPRLRCGFDAVDRPLSSAGAKAMNVPLVASQVGKARQGKVAR